MQTKRIKTNISGIEDTTLQCCNCKESFNKKEFYNSESKFFIGIGKIPYCKKCIHDIYEYFCERYIDEGCDYPEKKAVRRICMGFDIYYSEKAFNNALDGTERKNSTSIISEYLRIIHLFQYKNKTYDSTINEEIDKAIETYKSLDKKDEENNDGNDSKIRLKTKKFFGMGFSDSDYEFLQEQYNDWIARHECKTKVQEEVFKQICFTQLELLKATRCKQDTKDLNATFLKQLEAAKLQPKQNTSETLSDTQTFGTLLDKWENTRPLPEIDEELKDVDNIGKYINVFFKGHLAKMMGIKNAFSNSYTKFMEKYTVKRPEYDSDDENSSEVIFDAIFGGKDNE